MDILYDSENDVQIDDGDYTNTETIDGTPVVFNNDTLLKFMAPYLI